MHGTPPSILELLWPGRFHTSQYDCRWSQNTVQNGVIITTAHGTDKALPDHCRGHQLTCWQLSKEDENAGQEVEVRREDQDKINRFSRLHQRELLLEDELKAKNVRPIPRPLLTRC